MASTRNGSDAVHSGESIDVGGTAESPGVMSKQWKTDIDSGRSVCREFRPGFSASVCDVTYSINTKVEVDVEPSLFFGVVTGEACSTLSIDGCDSIEIKPLCPLLVSFGDYRSCVGELPATARCSSVGLCMTRQYLETMAEDYDTEVFGCFLSLLRGDVAIHRLPQSGQLLASANNMLQSPYEGTLSAIYLESCALALLAETGRIIVGERDKAAELSMTRREYSRVQEIREILEQNIVDPPTLSQLSRQIGINATTMSNQFRRVFGSTIFSFLRDRRLELARAMLLTESLPVSQVGYRVGFNNPAAFATAYRRRFGRPPSAENRRLQ